jgi:MFS family permease
MVNPAQPLSAGPAEESRAWYRQLNGYHWLVLVVGTLAWAFDCLSQQIFNLTRKPAMDLLTSSATQADFFGPLSTTALLVGWATGGIIFGILGDRIGRAKTLTIMILCYSASTGLCGLSVGAWDYIGYCFLTGIGAGGIFPIACTLVAESLPDSTRPQALGMVQVFSALGNVAAGFISLGMIALLMHGVIATYWRWMFSVGIVPSLLAVIVMRKLREPEVWRRAVAEGKTRKAGLRELFAEPRWRRNAIVGLALATSGVVGLWGIGVFSNDLTQRFIGEQIDQKQRELGEAERDLQFVGAVIASPENLARARESVQPRQLLGTSAKDNAARFLYEAALQLAAEGKTVRLASVRERASAAGMAPLGVADTTAVAWGMFGFGSSGSPATAKYWVGADIDRILARSKARSITVLEWAAVTLIMFNVGAFFGMYAFARVTHKIGRRPTFAIFFLIAMVTTALAFWRMERMPQDLWMVVLMGGAQLSVFGGYAIYFPELFPTRLRSTGTSFCYNVGRYIAAVGPFTKGWLTSTVFASPDNPAQGERLAGVTMCACFVVGLVALLFAPETKGQPLPE